MLDEANGDTTTPLSQRPTRACRARSYKVNPKSPSPSPSPPSSPRHPQCRFVTPLLPEPSSSQLSLYRLRSTWQLASVLNFLNVFRPLLNINVDFSADELEAALITPNDTLRDIHIPLMRAIPPNTRNAIRHDTWITVLCRKLRDWWYWVAEGELPIVVARGAEIDAYNALDPVVRVLILKALCDIRVEQVDIRNYIDNTIKAGVHISNFRKERVGGDSYGISYWYEDDPVMGHRLYRETRKLETEKENVQLPASLSQWETVATNFNEFQDVSEKLFGSKNRTEVSLGKKLKNDMLPEIEKVLKNKETHELNQRKNVEKLMKKQQREALLLGSTINFARFGLGRSRRDRKHVTYTFDDYDRSINEAIKKEKKQLSPEPTIKREILDVPDARIMIRSSRSVQCSTQASLDASSPKSFDYDNICSNHQEDKPTRYSEKEFVEVSSEYEENEVAGQVMYDNGFLMEKKQKRKLSCLEGDKMYHLDKKYLKHDEAAEEDGTVDLLEMNVDSDVLPRFKNFPEKKMREHDSRSVNELQLGLRNGDKPTRIRITFKQHKLSEPEPSLTQPEKINS